MNDKIYDVVIIGGGPAGLTAGIYTSRDRKDTLLLEKAVVGGLPAVTDLVENYPGFPDGTKGTELMNKFKKQAEKFGVKFSEFDEVKNIETIDKNIMVRTERNKYSARTVIIASGSIPKKMGVSGEDKLMGRGVSYCATCDGPLFKDKDVAVIGCGNSGLQEGEALLNHVKSITFVEFLPYMNAEKILQERLTRHENTSFLLNHQLLSINGDDYVKSIRVKDRSSELEKLINIDGVFVYVGFLPNTNFLSKKNSSGKDVVELDDSGYIITDRYMKTSLPGVFAVGDVRSKKFRQIAEAVGDATVGALAVSEYISELN
ncbi:MAG: FAD-dependent oxidoreductase [Candidatus Marinimicrobia bacterium]|nr:FAD-dependent oxidoreductase [Candidatus Neomarinimicrobiota bacterium]